MDWFTKFLCAFLVVWTVSFMLAIAFPLVFWLGSLPVIAVGTILWLLSAGITISQLAITPAARRLSLVGLVLMLAPLCAGYGALYVHQPNKHHSPSTVEQHTPDPTSFLRSI